MDSNKRGRVDILTVHAISVMFGPTLFSLIRGAIRMSHATLRELVAADVMQRDMVTVAPDDTLRDALALMTDSHVTGLPVMDDKSRCIGLITASDILGFEEEHAEDIGRRRHAAALQSGDQPLGKRADLGVRLGRVRRRARRRSDDAAS